MRKLVFGAFLAALTLVACTTTPGSPSVSFTAPLASQPANGTSYTFKAQPVTVAITNVVRTAPATVTYLVEVATDAGFTNKVFTKDAIAEGSGDTTSLTISSLPGNTTYYWHWKPTINGIAGQPSPTLSFVVQQQIIINTPALVEPVVNAQTFEPRPTFIITNATRQGQVGTIFYEFQVSTSAAFSTIAASATVQEQATRTSWTPTADLPAGPVFWRARATDPSTGEASSFSSAITFTRQVGIDLASVIYLQGPNISKWPETGQLVGASHFGTTLCTDFNSNWPTTDFFGDPGVQVIGNQWLFVLINNKWYGGAGHWLRPGQTCKGEIDDAFFPDAFNAEPFHSLVLRGGEKVGLMVSTPARFWPEMKTLDQRTNVLIIDW